MGKDPAFLFYSSDFLIGTVFMSNEQIGKYVKLLCFQHQFQSLTKEQVIAVTVTWDEIIMAKFVCENGTYFNQRLRDEADKRIKYCQSRRDNRISHEKDMSNIRETHDSRMENENENRIKTPKKQRNNIDTFKPPTFDDVKAYCLEASLTMTDEEMRTLLDFYQSKGWKVGAVKMRDWKASVRNWHRRQKTMAKPWKPGSSDSDIDNIIRTDLGNIATVDMIKKVMAKIPGEAWFKIQDFLARRYPGGGNGYQKAFTEMRNPIGIDKLQTLTNTIGKVIL